MKKDIWTEVWNDWWSYYRVVLTITIPILISGIVFNLVMVSVDEPWFIIMDWMVNTFCVVSALAIIVLIFILVAKMVKAKKNS